MTVPVIAVGDPVTATYLNLASGFENILLDPVVFKGTDSGAQTLTTALDALLNIGTELKDPYGGHSGTSPTYTIPSALNAFRLRVYGACSFAANATGMRRLYIRQNGVLIPGGHSSSVTAGTAVATALQSTVDLVVATGDTLDMIARQDSGGNLATVAGQQVLEIQFIGVA